MPSVLITGASTGIGRATAQQLAGAGYRVFAGVRDLSDAPPKTSPVLLDVTDPAQIAAAAQRIDPGDLAAVINNAGYNYVGPFEYSEAAASRELMEVNFFGPCRIAQAFLPHLRQYAAAHRGETAKLINISSIGGLIGIPWEVFYHASKFALVGITEGLRSELWSQNIRAVVVCPGGIRTEFMPKTRKGLEAALAALPEAAPRAYVEGLRRFEKLIGTAGRFGSPPERVAGTVLRVMRQRNPRLRQLVGADARMLSALSWMLPQGLFGALLRAQFAPVPAPSS